MDKHYEQYLVPFIIIIQFPYSIFTCLNHCMSFPLGLRGPPVACTSHNQQIGISPIAHADSSLGLVILTPAVI